MIKSRKVGEELEIAETYSLIAWNDYFPSYALFFLLINLFILLYNIVLVSTYIDLSPP